MQRTLNEVDAELFDECIAAAQRNQDISSWPTAGDGPLGTEGVRRKLIGIQAAGLTGPATVRALVADLIATTVSSESSAKVAPTGLALQSGLGRAGIPGAFITLVPGGSPTEIVGVDGGSMVQRADAATAALDGPSTVTLATVTALGAAAAQIGFVDALAGPILVELRETKSANTDRWAGQALRHEIANAVMSRDIAVLHGLHALEEPLESETATTFSLLALLESEQAVSAAVDMARRLAGVRGDLAAARHSSEIRDTVATLGDLAGSGTRLRQWIYGVAVRHA